MKTTTKMTTAMPHEIEAEHHKTETKAWIELALELVGAVGIPGAHMGTPEDMRAYVRKLALEQRGAAWATLQRLVDNTPGPDVLHGASVTLEFNPEMRTYSVDVRSGEESLGAEAPTLAMAVLGAGYCSEGEHMALGVNGVPVCWDCRGAGCDWCFDGKPTPMPSGWENVAIHDPPECPKSWTSGAELPREGQVIVEAQEVRKLLEGAHLLWVAMEHALQAYPHARTALRRAGSARVIVSQNEWLPQIKWPPSIETPSMVFAPTAAECFGYPNDGEWPGED